MTFSTHSDDGKIFEIDEFLTPQQIMRVFLQHVRKSDAARELVISELQQRLE